MYDRRELCKVVRVSDPDRWYGQKKVEVKLFICPEYKGTTMVKIFVASIDDFAMECVRECYGQSDIDQTYEIMKKYMFDPMPRRISCKWLMKHGYFPF